MRYQLRHTPASGAPVVTTAAAPVFARRVRPEPTEGLRCPLSVRFVSLPPMTILQRYVLREILSPLLLGLVVFTFVFLAGQVFQFASVLFNEGLDSWLLLQFVATLLPGILALTVPMAFLLAILLGVGRLAADREILAIRSSGVNIMHICTPIMVLGALLAAILMTANWRVIPHLSLLNSDIMTQMEFNILSAIPADRAVPLEGRKGEARSYFMFDRRDPETGAMLGVNIITEMAPNLEDDKPARAVAPQAERPTTTPAQRAAAPDPAPVQVGPHKRPERPQNVVLASSGIVDPRLEDREIDVKLTSGAIHIMDPEQPHSYTTIAFGSLTKTVNPSFSRTAKGFYRKSPREYSSPELLALMDPKNERAPRFMAEFCERLSVPLACLAFPLIAFPLAIYVKPTGKAVAFAVSFFVILFYYAFLNYGTSITRPGSIVGPVFIFLPNALLALLGLIMIRHTAFK